MARSILPRELEAFQEVLALLPERAVDHLLSALHQGEVDGQSKEHSLLAVLAHGAGIQFGSHRHDDVIARFCSVYSITEEWQETVSRYTVSIRFGDRTMSESACSEILCNLIEICEQDKTERRLLLA